MSLNQMITNKYMEENQTQGIGYLITGQNNKGFNLNIYMGKQNRIGYEAKNLVEKSINVIGRLSEVLAREQTA